ncbi:MAG: hypothetical protein Q9221_006095 [Calogaya cf. arnoldii]
MEGPANVTSLPPELQDEIIGNLEWPDKVCLKMTCKHYDQFIPSLSLDQLLEAEKSVFSEQRDLYACQYCLRLRDYSDFADKMREKRKGRGHKDAAKRFCVECGLNAPEGTTRYSPGAEISMEGVVKIICVWCKSFKLIGKDIDGNRGRACVDCQADSNARARIRRQHEQEREMIAQLERLAVGRETRRLERERRKAHEREVWGSEYEDSESEEWEERRTWQDEQMDLIHERQRRIST